MDVAAHWHGGVMARSIPNLYPVRLSREQRVRLEAIARLGRAPASKVRHAQVLLLSDRNRRGGRMTRIRISEALGMHINTIARICRRFVQDGEAPALNRKIRATPPTPPKLDGRGQAQLVAICCGPPPAGRRVWTLRLLAQELVSRRIVTGISREAVRKTLKKMNCNPGAGNAGASPNAMRHALSHNSRTSWIFTRRPIHPTSR